MTTVNICKADTNTTTKNPIIFFSNPSRPTYTNGLYASLDIAALATQGVPYQIPFSYTINTPSDPIQTTVLGDLIFNDPGIYSLSKFYFVGKSSASAGTSFVMIHTTIDGVQPISPDGLCTLDNQNVDNYIRVPTPTEFITITSPPTVYRFYIWMSTTGTNNGRLQSLTSPEFPASTPSFGISVNQLFTSN